MKNITDQRLQDALNRLLERKPLKTKADGKISIKRINDEAGLSQGAIYYYKEFISKAKIEIELYKQNQKKADFGINEIEVLPETKRLRKERDNEKRLKDKYREEKDSIKCLSDEIVQANVTLAFRVLELENEMRRQSESKVIHLPR